ncbi:hypothetical protein MPSEU_000817500 [Mayamaea pseudoterrestris]|nr:hypothetical protein MPSEU_000817500 [Mayamaea pseudoterrestris]
MSSDLEDTKAESSENNGIHDVEQSSSMGKEQEYETSFAKDKDADAIEAATSELSFHSQQQNQSACPSHFRNSNISAFERFGLPAALTLTMILLLVSDIGSGVSVIRQLVPVDDVLFNVQTQVILTASVFTSVKSLWDTGSYALVVLVVLTSISWPYIKMLLTLYAWIMPFHKKPLRRERLLVWLDALGKWSFVDIVVFLEIAVVFRSSIDLGGPSVEVYVLPRYGIFGFVCATMLSLVWTQRVLYRHRSIIYRPIVDCGPEEEAMNDNAAVAASTRAKLGVKRLGKLKNCSVVTISFLLLASIAMFIAGITLYVYQVSSLQGSVEREAEYYSIVKLGAELPTSSEDGTFGRMTWLAIVWFFLGVVFPLVCMILCCVLLHAPLTRRQLERLLFWTEVSFAWSSAEVFAVSTIFAISQVPKFGNGLIKSGCVSCYVVNATLMSTLGVLLAASVTYIFAAVWLFRLVHPVVFSGSRI